MTGARVQLNLGNAHSARSHGVILLCPRDADSQNGLFLRALCDMTGARVQLNLGNKHSARSHGVVHS